MRFNETFFFFFFFFDGATSFDLIPAYNSGPWIAETIKSALNETWPSKEIIIVDDGFRDDTLAIARRVASRDVTGISQENQGASAARNIGSSFAREINPMAGRRRPSRARQNPKTDGSYQGVRK